MKNKILSTIGLASLLILSGCNMSSKDTDNMNIGYFVDSPVEGVSYETASGITGVTDKNGSYKYMYNEEVTFKIGNLILGTTETKNMLTPEDLMYGDKEKTDLMLRMLQSMDKDNNLSNGIEIPKEITESLREKRKINFYNNISNDKDILLLSIPVRYKIDINLDGKIDINSTEAENHFLKTKGEIEKSNGNINKFIKEFSKNLDLNKSNVVEDNFNDKNVVNYISKNEKISISDFYKTQKVKADLYSLWSEQFDNILLNMVYSTRSKPVLGMTQEIMSKYNIGLKDYSSDYSKKDFELLRGEFIDNYSLKDYDRLVSSTTSKDNAVFNACILEVQNIKIINFYLSDVLSTIPVNKDLYNLYKKAQIDSYNNYSAFKSELVEDKEGSACPDIKNPYDLTDIGPGI